MASAYVNSDKISVFPSTRRGNTQVSARLLSEESIASIVNKFLDKDGFIITNKSSIGLTSPLEFNIHGYYFRVESINDILNNIQTSTATKIYANIILKQAGNYIELFGQDDQTVESGEVTGSVYKGVTFSTNSPISSQDGRVYSLEVLSRTSSSSSWQVANNSYIKFGDSSLDIDLDGGEI